MLQRLIFSGLTYFAAIYLAEKMGAALYGQLAFIIFYIKSLSAMNLGISYGFIFFSYKSKDIKLLESYVVGYFIIGLISVVIGGILIDKYIFLCGVVLLPIFILDPFLKIKRIYIFSLLPEFFLAAAFLVPWMVFEKADKLYIIVVLMMLVLLSALAIYLCRQKLLEVELNPRKLIRKMNWIIVFREIKILIRKGHASYLYQLALFCFLFTDRYMLQKYYPAQALGTCMLAFQFCQASLYIMSSWNFSSVVDIGELIQARTLTISFILKKLSTSALVGVIPLVLFYFCLSYLENTYYKDYHNLSSVYAVIATGLYFSNLANSISPILFFFEKQWVASASVVACVIIVILSYYIVLDKNGLYLTVLEFNYSALAVSSLVTIVYALYVLVNVISKEEVVL